MEDLGGSFAKFEPLGAFGATLVDTPVRPTTFITTLQFLSARSSAVQEYYNVFTCVAFYCYTNEASFINFVFGKGLSIIAFFYEKHVSREYRYNP